MSKALRPESPLSKLASFFVGEIIWTLDTLAFEPSRKCTVIVLPLYNISTSERFEIGVWLGTSSFGVTC